MATGIVRRNDSASEIASREAARLVYGATSPYGRQPEIATVMSVTVADLKAWHERTVIPNGMIIGVSGDFDSAAMEKTLRAAFETLPEGKPIVEPKEAFPGPKPGVYFVDKSDVNQSNVRIVGLGTERSNPDYYALSIMNEVFSGGFGSRLFQDVRTKRGLAYAVGGAYGASYDHPGTFYVGASTKSATTVATAQAILDDIKDLKTQPFTEEELKRAKDQVLNSFIFRYDSVDKVLNEQAKLEFYGYPLDSLDQVSRGSGKGDHRRPRSCREEIHRPVEAGYPRRWQLDRVWHASLYAGASSAHRHHDSHAARNGRPARPRRWSESINLLEQ